MKNIKRKIIEYKHYKRLKPKVLNKKLIYTSIDNF